MKNNIVNYKTTTSGTTNYGSFESSSAPESFPNLVGNGIHIEYRTFDYTGELVSERVGNHMQNTVDD
jgi:hypothetical protein